MEANKTIAPDIIIDGKGKFKEFAKSKLYDLIAVGLVASMLALVLDVLQIKELTLKTFGDTLIEFVPFYLVALLLNVNYYNKGVYSGKLTDGFRRTVSCYSEYVNKLTGDKVTKLPSFCNYYNEKSLKDLQEAILKPEGLTVKIFEEGYTNEYGNKIAPLKTMCRRELKTMYSKDAIKAVRKAKRTKVNGVNNNFLLGNYNSADATDLGPSERELKHKRTRGFAVGYVFSLGIIMLIGLRDIMQWNWMSVVLILFKLLYVICRAVIRYFDGYEDITVNVTNHISRKTDILKEYDAWYAMKLNNFNNNPGIKPEGF